MRIREIDLIRYGCFTGARVDLPPSAPDIHILVGPNEAGKSTVLAALEDLLFGIPLRSQMAFLHSYRDMRIGAVLEANGSTLAMQRRKGRKDTLLAADETPIASGERALLPFLANATREHFERMFSLDHERLRKGGQEILEAKGDLGEALFSATSGYADLRGRGRALEQEAGGLWTKRRSAKRRYYQAHDRLQAAERDIRERTVNVRKWRELRNELESRQKEYDELGQRILDTDRRLRRLSRIRRVARLVADKARLDEHLRQLGQVPALPEDARKTLRAAEEQETIATHKAQQRQEDLDRARTARASLAWDESLLLRAEEIDLLHRRRLQVEASRSDLPKRQAELNTEVVRLRDLASELGWEIEDADGIIGRIPSQAKVAEIRELLADRTERLADLRSADRALHEAREQVGDVRIRLGEAPEAKDVSRLSSVLTATRQEHGDVPPEIRGVERDLIEATASAWEIVERLRPSPGSVEAAEALAVPSVPEVQSHREAHRRLEREMELLGDQIAAAESAVRDATKERDQIVAEERPVHADDVTDLRSRRDAGWQLVRRKYIEGDSVPDEKVREFAGADGSVSWAYEQSVLAADRAADRRVETASAVARLAEASRTMASRVEALEDLRRKRSDAVQRRMAADAKWRAAWEQVPFEPLSPDIMLLWLESHEQVRQAVTKRNQRRRELELLRRRESAAAESVLSELRDLGVDTDQLRKTGLLAILERGGSELRRQEQAAQTRRSLETESKRVKASLDEKEKARTRAGSALDEWAGQWAECLRTTLFARDDDPVTVTAQTNIIDRMRPVAADIENLRNKRIGLIRRDIESYEKDARALVSVLAPDLAEANPDEAVIELERRLADARAARQAAGAKDKEIGILERKIQQLEEQRHNARESVVALQAEARVTDVPGLRIAIEKAEQARTFSAERERVMRDLSAGGDGLAVEALEEECRYADLDEVASREQDLRTQIDELRGRQATARDRLRDAKRRFQEVGGGDAAAAAEGARQDALAEIGEIARQYVKKRAAALLLQWAIDRNRRERQGPLLRRAGELFAELTLGSFEALELDFDEADRARLVGRRPSGERVDTDGMSAGSADQLYLALRVAALESYADGASLLPFVADDLFVNFDDQRSEAGFRVLGRLASSCQVLFLTHHEHLVEVAGAALAGKVQVGRLTRSAGAAGYGGRG